MHIVTLEDATYILQKDRLEELSFLDDIFSNIRKGGIHLLSVTHCPSRLSPGIISASANKIAFLLNSGEDRAAVQRHMGIIDEAQKEYFCNLNYKEHEVIIEFAKRARPFVGNIPHVELDAPMSKKELYENNKRIIAGFPKPVERAVVKNDAIEKKAPEVEQLSLVSDERKFLLAVSSHQYKLTLTEIYSFINLSAGKGTRISKKLERNMMIKIFNIIKGKGISKYPVLLDAAYKTLGIEEAKFEGRGCGCEHLIWQHILAEYFKDYKAAIELNRGNKCIDVAFEYKEKLIAVEVAMTSAHEKANIEKDIGMAKADLVIIGCKDEKVLGEVDSIIQELGEGFKGKARAFILSKILAMKIEEVLNEKT